MNHYLDGVQLDGDRDNNIMQFALELVPVLSTQRTLIGRYDAETNILSADYWSGGQLLQDGAPYGVNIDGHIILDFDRSGKLLAIELILPVRRLIHADAKIPLVQKFAIFGLRSLPAKPSSVNMDDGFDTRYSVAPNGSFLRVTLKPSLTAKEWYALGPNVFIGMNGSELSEFCFQLDAKAIIKGSKRREAESQKALLEP